jgi:hypothetical protein
MNASSSKIFDGYRLKLVLAGDLHQPLLCKWSLGTYLSNNWERDVRSLGKFKDSQRYGATHPQFLSYKNVTHLLDSFLTISVLRMIYLA